MIGSRGDNARRDETSRGARGSLAWYPASWRERYGDELTALMEDTAEDGRPSLRIHLSVAWAGLKERSHEAGLIGLRQSPGDRVRTGALLVLVAWAVFLVAGTSFAKLAEWFEHAVPEHRRALPVGGYDTVVVAAAVGGLVVLCGAAVALPCFVRFIRAGGWQQIRAAVWRAVAATTVAIAALVATGSLAHTLTPAQRGGGGPVAHPLVWYYLIVFMAMVVLCAVALALWTAAAVATVRRLELPRRTLVAEAILSAGLSFVMAVMTVATSLWWGAMASWAPWFLQGGRPGSSGSPVSAQVVVTMSLMVVACALAGYGVVRSARSWKELETGAPGAAPGRAAA